MDRLQEQQILPKIGADQPHRSLAAESLQGSNFRQLFSVGKSRFQNAFRTVLFPGPEEKMAAGIGQGIEQVKGPASGSMLYAVGQGGQPLPAVTAVQMDDFFLKSGWKIDHKNSLLVRSGSS